ncbi:uncharacterized protein LOC130896235 [Diorhabda carinulata]|uniref:uncharacterized protein LOC130896235 n=1 Tax=Diorhabda carinulata TaxID=1163345 RepID=UPI0025A1EC58|nr:uncharacterized protein LOC130896235 [Diorhabda carinulata]
MNSQGDFKLFENSIKYLHNISTLSPMNVPALKSSLSLKRTLMSLRKNIHIPTYATRPNMHCQRCFLNFHDGPATYEIKSKPTQYKFAQKMLAKQKKGLPLTKYQKKYLEKYNKFSGNTLVTTCHFCKKATCTKLPIPKTKKKPKVIASKNKNKKKKDKLCGLNENVVITNRNKKENNKTLLGKKLFSNTKNSLQETTCDNSLIIISNSSTNNSIGNDKIQKLPTKRRLEVIDLDSDDSIQEVPQKKKFKIKKKQEIVIQTPKPLKKTPKDKKKMEKNHMKLNKLMNTSTENDKSSGLLQLLEVSKDNPTEVISLDSDDSVQEVSIKTKTDDKKYQKQLHTSTPVTKNNKKKKKNKNKKLSKLISNSGKKNKSSNLFQFLQSL